MTYPQPTDTNTASAFLKGCGIAALIVLVLLGALAYGGWRLFKKVEGAAADGTWTVDIGGKVTRNFGKGLATEHFAVTGSEDSSKSTYSSTNSYMVAGKTTVKSECISPVTAATPKQPGRWKAPAEAQRKAIVSTLEGVNQALGQKFAVNMRVNTEEPLVSAFNEKTGVLCVAALTPSLPLN